MQNESGRVQTHFDWESGQESPLDLLRVDGQDLPALVVATGRAGSMRGDSAAALRALVELRGHPAVGCLAGAQPHLRSFTLGNSHGERE